MEIRGIVKLKKIFKFLKNFSDAYILGSIREPKLRILKLENDYLESILYSGIRSTTV